MYSTCSFMLYLIKKHLSIYTAMCGPAKHDVNVETVIQKNFMRLAGCGIKCM